MATTSTTARGTTSTAGQTTGTLVPQTPTGTEFLSPSGNISCEIDFNFGSSSISQTMCLTLSPPRSATLTPDGRVAVCTGTQCLSNAGVNTPTLAYRMAITLGPFTCVSTTTSMRCTLAEGAGFAISSGGVTPLGNAPVS